MSRRGVSGLVASLVLVLLAGCCGSFFGRQVKLAEGGRAQAEIVIAPNAPVVVRFAANELKWHLEKMTGAKFEVIEGERRNYGDKVPIFVGESAASRALAPDLAKQEFLVDVSDSAIVLAGVDSQRRNSEVLTYSDAGWVSGSGAAMPAPFELCGTTYAVYEFLENQLGVRWLDSTDYGTIVPKRPLLSVAAGSLRTKPYFRFRGGTFEHSSSYSFWNSSSQARPEERAGYTNYQHFAYGGRSAGSINQQTRLYVLRHRAFGEKADANHSFYGWYDRFWNKDDPKNKRFEKYRPELFSKIAFGKPGQLCFSNPETIAQTVADVRAYFDGPVSQRRWGADICCLEPMDNNCFCECERCAPQYEPERRQDNSRHSTYWFRFVNAVAREIKKSHPWARISTLAYWSHEGMPTDLQLEDNVVVYFCLFENRQPFHNGYQKQFGRMLDWCKVYPERQFAMWLYNTFPAENYHGAGVIGVPGFFATEAEHQFDLFRKYNFTGGIFHCGMNGTIDSYLQYEWMIDPSLRAATMMDDFFAAYGAAAKPLRKFYEIVEERYCSQEYRVSGHNSTSPKTNWEDVCPKPVMDRLAELMAEAEAAVRDDEFAQARVRLFRLENWEYMLAGVRQYQIFKDAPLPVWKSQHITDAAGAVSRVPWDKLESVRHDMYFGGAKDASGLTATFKFANDDRYLYLEVAHDVISKHLMNDAAIAYCDDIELYFYAGYGNMYRTFFSSPDGRICAGDFGGGVWNRPPQGNLAPAFGAKCVSDTSKDGIWRTRYVLPLETLIDQPVKSGGKLRLNITSVLNPKHVGGRKNKHAILTATPFSGLHNITRMGYLELGE